MTKKLFIVLEAIEILAEVTMKALRLSINLYGAFS